MSTQHLTDLVAAVSRLANAIERADSRHASLGPDHDSRYTSVSDVTNDTVDERTMASLIGVTKRMLGEHRRRGRLPGCWVRNGRLICWMPEQTKRAWKRGIA